VELAHSVDAGMRTRLCIHNYAMRQAAHLELALNLAADFAGIRERERPSAPREQSAPIETTWDAERREVMFRYGHARLDRAVAVRVEQSPIPVRFVDDALVFWLELAPHQSIALDLVVEPIFDGKRHSPPRRRVASPEAQLWRIRQRLRGEAPSLTMTNTTVARAWQTAIEDLASLPLGEEAGPAAPSAGTPLYQQIFGRDMLTIGWQALLAMPTMLRDALRLNSAWQGTGFDDWLDEQPGRILDQARRGPLAILGLSPFLRYYGDHASLPDFLIGLGQYLAWTDDRETVRALLPAARKVVDWLDRCGDLDGDGFIEYVTRSSRGIKNQGWKDSDDAIVDEDGRIVPNPIAVSDVQGSWYAGLGQAALAFFLAGDWLYAAGLLRKALELKRRFHQSFWMEDRQFYAMALDPEKRQVRSIASNVGQFLATGIIPPEKARIVARRMIEPDMFSGWGIRTLSSDHVAYNPFSYHLGCVWPVEAGTTAFGFARYGCVDELHRLTEALFAASDLFVANRLPEALSGIPRDEDHPHPGVFPGSCEPQGWSSGAIIVSIQALLGMRPIAPLGLLLIDPHLPPWLPDLRLEGIRVGRGSVDLTFRRTRGGKTRCRVLRRQGSIRVLRQPVPQGPNATLAGRARAALASVIPAWRPWF
jgi:glycogen debranching enzyme